MKERKYVRFGSTRETESGMWGENEEVQYGWVESDAFVVLKLFHEQDI